MATTEQATIVEARTVRPGDRVRHWSWCWHGLRKVAIVSHQSDERVLFFFDDTEKVLFPDEPLWCVRAPQRTHRCACGETIGPDERWCSHRCYRAEFGLDNEPIEITS